MRNTRQPQPRLARRCNRALTPRGKLRKPPRIPRNPFKWFLKFRNKPGQASQIGVVSDIPKLMLRMAELPADFRDSETAVTSLEALGRAIRAKRKASGLRIDDAAALCGVSVDLLSRLENGKSGVSTDRVLRVLDGLGLVLLVVDKELTARIAASTPQGNS